MLRVFFSLALLWVPLAGCGDDGGSDPAPDADAAGGAGAPMSAGDMPADTVRGTPQEDPPSGDVPPANPIDGVLDGFGIEMGCDFLGSPFGHRGTAIIRGTGTLPDGLDPDYQLNLMLGAGGVQVGVLGENVFDIVSVCDTPTFKYQITSVEAGTYDLYVEVLDPNDDAATVYESMGDTSVTVADGETVEQDVRFD
ncbi:MAG: hypothetical protein OXU20_28515 [Myxococcales bacterium]|nr:hypothetical protein [Myxococcales bacterium]